jgi:hypothetical protein
MYFRFSFSFFVFIIFPTAYGSWIPKSENEYWAINVDMSSKQNTTVSYPTLGCSGKWI